MILKNIRLKNFRNYNDIFISFDSNINIIYGENGQGKTNLLESIYFLSLTKSYRTFNDSNLIKNNEFFLKIKGVFFNELLPFNCDIYVDKNKKNLKIDETEFKKIDDYIKNMNIIIFHPEDLQLIKGNPIDRRRYLNIQLSQINKKYLSILNSYEKLLKQRNKLLKKMQKKQKVDNIYFEIITDNLIEKAIYIYKNRKNYIENINVNSSKIFFDISKISDFNIKYKSNMFLNCEIDELKDKIKNNFENLKENEIKYGTTLIGPHRDDFEFNIGNKNMRIYSSQGQQRMAVISLKLSEIPIFKIYKKTYPILLLDDVFSELDYKKINNLLKYIINNIQVFITVNELKNINKKILKKAKLIKIEDGKIKEEV